MAEPIKISRRTLTKGVAWTVPAIAVVAAAPAMAASCGLTFTITGCKVPNQGQYTLALKVCNTCSTPLYWDGGVVRWMENNSSKYLDPVAPTSYPITLAGRTIQPGTSNCEMYDLGTFAANSMASSILGYDTTYNPLLADRDQDRSVVVFEAKTDVQGDCAS